MSKKLEIGQPVDVLLDGLRVHCVVREAGKFREVVIEVHPLHATVRLKGLRTGYDVAWSAIWSMAVRADVEKKRAEKKAAKRGVR